MNYNGFDVRYITYPEKSAGWIDGVYRERVREVCEAESVMYRCRRFREREESGWGVFDYNEGAVFSFPSCARDWEITASLCVSDGDCSVSAYCDGVCVLSGIALSDEPREITFTVHSCDEVSEICFSPDISDGEGEAEIKLEVISISYAALPGRPAAKKPTLFLASDSTVQTYDPYYYPQTGWGEVLHRFFIGTDLVREYRPEGSTYSQCRAYEMPDVIIENRAIGGRSARSFFLEGKLSELLSRASRGDYIIIQFGHNDCTKERPNRYTSPDDYKLWVERYIRASLSRGVLPILVTPVMRRNCGDGGDFSPSFPEFCEKLQELAGEYNVPLLDLGGASLALCRALGAERTKALYLSFSPGEYSGAYANGASDNTHLSRTGALIYAGEIARMLAESDDERLRPLGALIDMKRRCVIMEALDDRQN